MKKNASKAPVFKNRKISCDFLSFCAIVLFQILSIGLQKFSKETT